MGRVRAPVQLIIERLKTTHVSIEVVSQAYMHVDKTEEVYVIHEATDLPSLWNGETLEDEVIHGFSESSLNGWCQSHHFACYIP